MSCLEIPGSLFSELKHRHSLVWTRNSLEIGTNPLIMVDIGIGTGSRSKSYGIVPDLESESALEVSVYQNHEWSYMQKVFLQDNWNSVNTFHMNVFHFGQ